MWEAGIYINYNNKNIRPRNDGTGSGSSNMPSKSNMYEYYNGIAMLISRLNTWALKQKPKSSLVNW